MKRQLPYNQAVCEALRQAMELSSDVLVTGQFVDYKPGIFGTTTGLVEKFGPDRVHDFPIAEASMHMAAMGAALEGMRPVVCHQRLDFLLNSMDTFANWMGLWWFKSNKCCSLPITIRMAIGKGWGQGPQHSKSLHAWFAHIPGLNVVMPATPFDAKGMLLESIFGETPTVIIEGRPIYNMKGYVPEEPYRVRFGKGVVRKEGKDISLVALGWMVPWAMRIAVKLEQEGVHAEVIDPRSLRPLDLDLILGSVSKTKRLVVFDPGWRSFGVASEIITLCVEHLGGGFVSNRITLPDSHCPVSQSLEEEYYPKDEEILTRIRKLIG